jgi:hypothetical protein
MISNDSCNILAPGSCSNRQKSYNSEGIWIEAAQGSARLAIECAASF